MNKNAIINLRVSSDVKASFQQIVEKEGFSMSDVLAACMEDVAKRGYVPINLRSKISRNIQPGVTIPFIKKCLEEIVPSVSKKIKTVYLFGSYAKGEQTSRSDVDLFLDFEDGLDAFEVAKLGKRLEESLGKEVDLVTDGDNERFMDGIQREWIPLYERRA
jgi:predicted nucleotidyltransferase